MRRPEKSSHSGNGSDAQTPRGDVRGHAGRTARPGNRRAHGSEEALDIAAVAVSAEMVGGMQRLVDMTVEYARTRKQFGRAIGSFQAVQHQCADMLVLPESSRSAAYYAAWAMKERPRGARPSPWPKPTRAKATAIGQPAIQVQGGMGFTWENDAHLFYRRAKASEMAFGDASSIASGSRKSWWTRRKAANTIKPFWPRMHANERKSYSRQFAFIRGLIVFSAPCLQHHMNLIIPRIREAAHY